MVVYERTTLNVGHTSCLPITHQSYIKHLFSAGTRVGDKVEKMESKLGLSPRRGNETFTIRKKEFIIYDREDKVETDSTEWPEPSQNTDWDLNSYAGTQIQPKPRLGLEPTCQAGLKCSQNPGWDLNLHARTRTCPKPRMGLGPTILN